MNHSEYKSMISKARAYSATLDERDEYQRNLRAARMNEQAAQQRAQTIQSMQTKKYELDERKLGVSQPKTQYVSALPILDTVDSVVNPALKQNTPVVQGLKKAMHQYAPAPTLANVSGRNNYLSQSNPVVNSFQTAMPNASLVQQATNNFQQWNNQYKQDEDLYIDAVDRVASLAGWGAPPDEEANRQLEETEAKLNQTKEQEDSMLRQTLTMLGPGAEEIIKAAYKDAIDQPGAGYKVQYTQEETARRAQNQKRAQELRNLIGADLYGKLYQYVYEQDTAAKAAKKQREEAEAAAERRYRLEAKYYTLSSVTASKDFEEKSQYHSTAKDSEPSLMTRLIDNAVDGGTSDWDDPLYEAVNGNEEARAYLETKAATRYGAGDNALGALYGYVAEGKQEVKQMTEEEVGVFNYLYATEGKEVAHEYYDLLQELELNPRQRAEEEETFRQWANDGWGGAIGSSIFGVATSPLKALSAAGQFADYITTGKIDENAPYNSFAYVPNTIKRTVAQKAEEKWGPVASFAYQTGMSMAEFLYNSALTGAWAGEATLGEGAFKIASNMSLAIMGTGAAADATIEAKDRGLTDKQAFVLGTVAGAAEILTEKVSVESLLTGKWEDSAIKFVLKNSLAEGSEEVGSNVINTIADVLVAKDKSQWKQSIQAYRNSGLSEEEAFRRAMMDQALEMGLDYLGGTLSGGVMAGMQAWGNRGYWQAQPAQRQTGSTDTNQSGFQTNTQVQTPQDVQQNPFEARQTQQNAPEPENAEREKLNETMLSTLRQIEQQKQAQEAQTQETVKSQGTYDDLANQEYIASKAGIAGGGATASDASAQDQLNGPTLAAMNELSGQKAEQTADGVGAKTSDFAHKVAPSQTHGLEGLEAKIGTPKGQQTPIEHEVITNAEAKNNARLRLEQDYEGEKTQLLETNRWNSEEAAMSDVILSDLKAEAEKTGDWSAYSDFRKERAARISDAARVLQLESQNAQPRSGDAILEAASKALDTARKSTDKDAVMATVSEYAKMYDKANADKSVSELRDIIQAVAVERKNASFFTRILKGNEDVSNVMNWALNRVCKYAEAELQQEAAQADVVPVFEAGAPDGGFYEFLQNLAANSIKSIATDKEKTGVGNAVLTIKRMAHLSKSATTIRNLISNNVFDVVDSVSNNISVPLDMLLSKYTGTRSVAVDKSWFSSAKRTGSIDGLAMSLLEVGLDASSTKSADAAKYGTSKRTFHKANGAVSSLISTMEKYQGYLLNSTDEWQKGGIEAEVQRGIDELYAQGKIADDSLREVGKETAGYRTFQDDSKLSEMSSKFRKGLNELTDDIPGGVRAGDFTMPFIQVGSNLVSRVSEYSPVGLTTNLVRLGNILWQCHEGKTITAAQQAKAVKGIGRGINGSVLIAAATWLAAKGIIHIANASGGEDDDKVASDSSKGLTGVQVNWSALHRLLQGQDTKYQYGDKMNSLDYLQPFNGHMTIGALIAEDIKENDGVTFSGIANASIDGVFQQLYELPVFQTFRDFNQAIYYSKEKTEGGKLRDATTNVIANNVVGTIVPNALRGIAAGTDPYVRDEYSSDTTLGRAWDKTKGSIPGYRKTLPIKQDVYGHDIETGYTGIGNFLNENINPGKNVRYAPTPTTEVLDGIAQEAGDNSVYLSKKVPNYVTVNSTRIDLSYDQQRQFKSERGAAFESVIPTLNAAANSNGLDGQMKVKAVSIAQDYAAQVAKQSLNIGFEADDWVQELQGKSDEEIAQTIIGKALESAAKKIGGTKYAGMAEQIRGGTPEETVLMALTDNQKENYSKYIQKAKVPAETYLDVLSFESKAKSDDKEAKNSKTKKEKVVAYIDGLKLTRKQKRALYLCFYSEKDDTFK